MEINRLLKIIISLIKVKKMKIEMKINEILLNATDKRNLRKPPLGIQRWGPMQTDVDAQYYGT